VDYNILKSAFQELDLAKNSVIVHASLRPFGYIQNGADAVLQALLESGRYPATVYPVWLRVIVTFVIPIAVATTIPLQALRGELEPGRILLFILISVISFWVATKVWKLGLKRYSGASS
jgi:ABC-type uncharacterized transport system permease subunit